MTKVQEFSLTAQVFITDTKMIPYFSEHKGLLPSFDLWINPRP